MYDFDVEPGKESKKRKEQKKLRTLWGETREGGKKHQGRGS